MVKMFWRGVNRCLISVLVLFSVNFMRPYPAAAADIEQDGEAGKTVLQWGVFEKELVTRNRYGLLQRYQEMNVTATFSGPDGATYTVPGFWDGHHTWRVRFAPPLAGQWSYTIDASDEELDAAENDGSFFASPPDASIISQNPNYRGFLQISENGRYFTYADGTPFFWLGGTAWRSNWRRMSFAPELDEQGQLISEFQLYVKDRRQKGFTVIQLRAGADNYGIQNEGGPTFHSATRLINPFNFHWLDKRIQFISDQGLVPVIVGQWYMDAAAMSQEEFEDYWRYLVARYHAYNVIWVISGEYGFSEDLDKLRQVGDFVHQLDATGHLTTIHPTPNPPFPAYSSSQHFAGEEWLDFHFQQTWDQTATRNAADSDYRHEPAVPFVNSEAGYDGLWGWDRDMVRHDAWTVYMRGGAGYTYGANGIFNWNDGCCDDETYEPPRWYDVIDLPSSYDMKHLADFFGGTRWWELAPVPDALESGDLLASQGSEYVAYLPGPMTPELPDWLNWLAPFLKRYATAVIDLSQEDGLYDVNWFNPRTGEFLSAGVIFGGRPWPFIAPFEGDVVLHITAQ